MKLTFVAFFLTITATAFSQFSTDTIFFNSKWEELENRDSAKYYRLYQRETNYLYHVVDYYIDGSVQMKGDFTSIYPSRKEGKFSYYGEDGKLTSECTYFSNKIEGEYKKYKDDKVIYSEEYQNGELNGKVIGYYEDGKVRRTENYKKGVFVDGKCFSVSGEEIKFFPREEMPEYVGGMSAMYTFIRNNVKYPREAIDQMLTGKVFLKFKVNRFGGVEDITVEKSAHPILDEEAIRVVKKMPKWKSGKQEGIPVDVYFNLPIDFKLN